MLNTTIFFKRFIATTLFAVLASPSLLLAQDLEIIVPAYANPGSDTNEEQGRQMWTDLIATSAQVGDKLNVILNPGNGPGGDQIDLNYIHDDPTPPPFPDFGSAPLVETRAGGADIYGYVATGFGPTGNADAGNPGRSLADVLADIDRYFMSDYYRWADVQTNGIFLDEMSQNVDNLGHYQAIYNHIKNEYGNVSVIANPGLNVDESFLSDGAGPVADTLVVFEGTGDTYANWTPDSWVTSGNYDSSQFAHIIHSESSSDEMLTHIERARQRNAGMVFVGPDNEYKQWPSYWQQEVNAITGVPEPTSLGVLGILAGMAITIRRKSA